MSAVHEFRCTMRWSGADSGKPFIYEEYSRDLEVTSDGVPPMPLSSAPAFLGDPSRRNPEDLLVAALSACHALTFLAICARSRITVLDYEDQAWGKMADVEKVTRFTEVVLRPRVTLADPSQAHRLASIHEKSHKHCFIANSVNFPVRVEPVEAGDVPLDATRK